MTTHATHIPLQENLPSTAAVIEAGFTADLHTAVQVYVSYRGQVIADDALGELRPGRPATPDDIMIWLSSGKPFTAVAILQLCEAHEVSLSDPVTRFLPEFGTHGKQHITLEQLLTHTSGLPQLDAHWSSTAWNDMLHLIYAAAPEAAPGQRARYQFGTTWVLLGEILQRVRSQTFVEALRESLLEPLQLERSSVGAMLAEDYAAQAASIVPMFSRLRGQVAELPWHEADPSVTLAPGGNNRGPARELGRFYEMLLEEGCWHDHHLLNPASVHALRTRHRSGMFDVTFRHIIDYGLGVIIDSKQYGAETVPYGYGDHCSHQTFGHGGSQSSIAFADPQHELVVVVLTNGMPGEPRHNRRNRQINSAIYEDLGLA